MTGALLTVELDDAKWRQGVERARRAMVAPQALMSAIGVGLVSATQRRFDHGVDPDGNAWAPLNPEYAATKTNHLILVESGMLRRLTMSASGATVTVGTNRVYGAIHQFGGTIKPKAKKQLVFHLGGRLVRASSVFIPARPYLGFGALDQQVVEDAIDAVIGGALDGIGRPTVH